MNRSEHFPRLTIKKPRPVPVDLSERESVEEFEARGGVVQKIRPGQSAHTFKANRTRQEVLDDYRQIGHKMSGLE